MQYDHKHHHSKQHHELERTHETVRHRESEKAAVLCWAFLHAQQMVRDKL